MVSAVSGATSGNLIGKEWESAYWSREIIMGLDKSEHVHSLTAVVIPLLGEATTPPSNESISSLNEEHSMPASILYLSRIWKFYLWSLPTNLHIFQTYNEVAACSIDKYRIWLVWGEFFVKKKGKFFFFFEFTLAEIFYIFICFRMNSKSVKPCWQEHMYGTDLSLWAYLSDNFWMQCATWMVGNGSNSLPQWFSRRKMWPTLNNSKDILV